MYDESVHTSMTRPPSRPNPRTFLETLKEYIPGEQSLKKGFEGR